MDDILQWADALAYFGQELEPHRKALSKATDATHCLLACRSADTGQTKVTSGGGEHAERKLIVSDIWVKDVDAAIDASDPRAAPMIFMLVINRSPCSDCAHLLAASQHQLNDRYSLSAERQHLILASLGYYHSNKVVVRKKGELPKNFTTDRGVRATQEAG